jgi:signal transduction histidine kinase
MSGTPVALPAGAEVALYRIAQEALTNALKHAGPGASATVTLRWSAGTVELEVCDDGRGSGPQLPAGGHGVIGMRERATLFGGTLEAGPAAGGGYRVRARVPVAATEAVPA